MNWGKTLPQLPNIVNGTAPAPLKARRFIAGDVRPDPVRKPRRPLSWSEEQINMLQRENKELRQHIINQRRREVEKDQAMATLQQENASHARVDDLVDQFANAISVALEELREGRKRLTDNPQLDRRGSHKQNDSIDEIINIYDQTGLQAQNHGSSIYL
jgi:hypothetical protein